MGVITERERQKYFAYLNGVADGLTESRNDINSVLNKIRAEIDEIPLSEPMVSADGLYCYGSKSITMGHFREKVLEIIDRYRRENDE